MFVRSKSKRRGKSIIRIVFAVAIYGLLIGLMAQEATTYRADEKNRNRPDRVEWFRDAGFGLFITWGVDSQLGSVISHSMVGASEDYLKRLTDDLPKSFNPKKFDPEEWAILAKLAGIKYVVFTAKHHSGFCMFATATTDFSVINTRYGRDITARVINAFREQGIAVGYLFSPDDFHWLYKHGKLIDRNRPEVAPSQNPGLMDYDKAQLEELLTRYGPIDVLFLDGPPEGLKELAWDLQPNIVVTRGAMETPEQYVPGTPIEEPWETCQTMGESWEYKPTNEVYKSGTELINMLIETRAKGGNLLLNVGPKPDGELPVEHEARLREIALWNFVNGESIYDVRPWTVTNESDIWFTKRKNEDTVYAFIENTPWKLGEWKSFTLKSVQATGETVISVLGQNDKILEYRPEVVPQTKWQQDEKGLHITVMRAKRLYNNRKWPNPVVLKITHAKPGLKPPAITTGNATWDPVTKTATLYAELKSLGNAESVEISFQYRSQKALTDMYERTTPWHEMAFVKVSAPGVYSQRLAVLKGGEPYEFRAIVKHPSITLYGREVAFRTEK